MFKFVLFSVLLAAVVAMPSEDVKSKRSTILTDAAVIPLATPLKAATVIHEPTLAKIGDYVQSVPTAISHQSSTIVHDRANVVTPIVAPALKTRFAPFVSDYSLPLYRSHPSLYQYSYPYTYSYVY